MPQVQQEWAAAVQNPLIACEQDYDTEQQTQLAEQRIPLLNHNQRSAFDLIMQAIEAKSGQCFFLHGPDGTGKTFVYNTLCPSLHSKVKIVICVASSGIASLLLKGGCTIHSTFKVLLDIHESSSCNIRKNSDLAELICCTDLIIWDKAPMQHHNIHKTVNRAFQDICDSNV